MSLFKKYISIIQEASYDDSEKRDILKSINDPEVFSYLINEDNQIIDIITFDNAKTRFRTYLVKLINENKLIDEDSKEKIGDFLKFLNNDKNMVKEVEELEDIRTKEDEKYEESDKVKLFNSKMKSVFIFDDTNTISFRNKIVLNSSIGNIIAKNFSSDPVPFIKDYKLVSPKKLVDMSGKQIIKKLQTLSTKKTKKDEPKQKSISSSIDDKFYKVLSSILNFTKDQINEILKDNKVSEMRARTMSIGYFFDEVNERAFKKYGYYMNKVGDEILFNKNKPSYDMNTSIKSLKLEKDELDMLISNTLIEAEEEDKVTDKEDILSMTLNKLKDAFPKTFEKFIKSE